MAEISKLQEFIQELIENFKGNILSAEDISEIEEKIKNRSKSIDPNEFIAVFDMARFEFKKDRFCNLKTALGFEPHEFTVLNLITPFEFADDSRKKANANHPGLIHPDDCEIAVEYGQTAFEILNSEFGIGGPRV
jgi:hypothetical protein